MIIIIIIIIKTLRARAPRIPTWLAVPAFAVSRHAHAPPPQANGAVEAEKRVARCFLIKLSVSELLVQRAQLSRVVLVTHLRARVLVPVARAHRHRQVDRGQSAQHARDHRRRGGAVVHHDAVSLLCLFIYYVLFFSLIIRRSDKINPPSVAVLQLRFCK